MGAWRGILVSLETLLVVALLAFSLRAAWMAIQAGGEPVSSWSGGLAESLADYGTIELVASVVLGTGVYWALQLIGRGLLAFWLTAAVTLLAQIPGIWAHNLLEWQRFFGFEIAFNLEQSLFLVAGQVLASLAALVCIRRTAQLRQLGSLITSLNLDAAERNKVLLFEGVALGITVATALLVAAAALLVSGMLGRTEALTERMPLAVIILGGGATLLLIAFAAFFRRSLGTR